MKRLIAVLLVLTLAVTAFAGCSAKKMKVAASIFTLYDFSKQVLGDKNEVVLLTPTDTNPHSYNMTKDDLAKLDDCDVLVCVGDESWLENVTNENLKIIKLLDMNIEFLEAGKSAKKQYDEHVWMSIDNVKIIVDELVGKFSEIRPGQRSALKKNADAYKEQLTELNGKFVELFDTTDKTIAVSDRNPFRYFAAQYGLNLMSPYDVCISKLPDIDMDVFEEYLEEVEGASQSTIFYTELSNKRLAQQIGMLSKADLLMLHSCHNISKSNLEKNVTYIELMEENLRVLGEGMHKIK